MRVRATVWEWNQRMTTDPRNNSWQRTNGSGALPASCVAALPPGVNASQCFFAEHVAVTMATPTFALNSQYDSFQVCR